MLNKGRPFGHFYHTMYQQTIGSYSLDDAAPFQFLEVGFFHGNGYDMYREFLPRGDCHSIEISCLPPGSREEGKWVSMLEKWLILSLLYDGTRGFFVFVNTEFNSMICVSLLILSFDSAMGKLS